MLGMATVRRSWRLILFFSVFAGSAFVLTAQPAGTAQLLVEVTAVQTGKGPVRISVWRDATTFLKGSSFRHVAVESAHDKIIATFESLEPGVYAVSAYQDVNNNGQLDTGFMGKPKEPYGFSNNARHTFGPATFEDAKFQLSSNGNTISFWLK